MTKKVFTNKTKPVASNKQILANNLNQTVEVVFSSKIEKNYSLKKLEKNDKAKLIDFIDELTHTTIIDLRKYQRQDYAGDIEDGEQIHHYGKGDAFRLHAYINGTQLVVVRIDPNHKYNGK